MKDRLRKILIRTLKEVAKKQLAGEEGTREQVNSVVFAFPAIHIDFNVGGVDPRELEDEELLREELSRFESDIDSLMVSVEDVLDEEIKRNLIGEIYNLRVRCGWSPEGSVERGVRGPYYKVTVPLRCIVEVDFSRPLSREEFSQWWEGMKELVSFLPEWIGETLDLEKGEKFIDYSVSLTSNEPTLISIR